MTPLHTPPVAAAPTSPIPLAPNQDYAEVVQQWVDNAPSGEERTVAAQRILNASQTYSFCLDLSDCSLLSSLPKLPDGLMELNLYDCRALTILPPDCLPAGLTQLDLSECNRLTTLPELPAGLTTLNLSYCSALTTLPELPAELEILDLTNCTLLTALPDLPAKLTTLNLRGCPALMALPNILPQHVAIIGYTPPHPIPTQWCQRAGKSTAYIVNLNNEWQKLQETDGFNHFATFLGQLGHAELRDSVSPVAVLEIIEIVTQSPDIRRLIFAASEEATSDCHDRRLIVFNTIQGLAQFGKLQRENAAPTAILDLATGMAKKALLDEAARPLMQMQWDETPRRRTDNAAGTGPNMREELEVQLALRHQLAGELNLPFPVNNPLYSTGSAQLNDADRAFAIQYVNERVNNKDRLIDALVAQPIWILHLESTIPKEELSAIDDHHNERLEKLAEQSAEETLNDNDYTKATDTVLADRLDERRKLFTQKTKEDPSVEARFQPI